MTLQRKGLAALSLKGLVAADRYAPTRTGVCVAPSAAIRAMPDAGAEQVDQLLFGERFEVLEEVDGWAFGQAARDGYVGHVPSPALGPVGASPTHWVRAPRTYAFAAPSIKAPPVGLYSMNALVAVEETQGRFLRAAGAGWLVAEHVSPAGVFLDDPAGVAEQFLGAPYLWGGRESLGLDCSGLVQQALYACGLACPRDSDQQAELGQPVDAGDLRRGDLVFWRGHVGIMLDGTRLLHANAHYMAVAGEDLADAVARIEAAGGGTPTAYRRVCGLR